MSGQISIQCSDCQTSIYDYYYLVGWKSKCSVIQYYLQMWKIIGCSLIKINIDNKQQINNTEDYNFAEHYVDIYTIYSDTEVRTGLKINAITGTYPIM